MILMSCISAFYYIKIVQFLFFNVTEKPKFYYTPSYGVSIIMILITFLNVFFCCAPYLLMDILYFENLAFLLDNCLDLKAFNNDLIEHTLLNAIIVNNTVTIETVETVDTINTAVAIVNPINPIDPIDPIDPIGPIDPIDPIGPIDPVANMNLKDALATHLSLSKNTPVSFEEYAKWFNSLDSESVKTIVREFSLFDTTYIYKGDAIDWYSYNLELSNKDQYNVISGNLSEKLKLLLGDGKFSKNLLKTKSLWTTDLNSRILSDL
jgi:hypothetical protein